MKIRSILALPILLGFTGSASAATITWGSANNITGNAGTGIAVTSIDPYPGRESYKSSTTTGTADIYSVGTSVLAVNFTGQNNVDYPINVTFFKDTPQATTFISVRNSPGLTQNNVTLGMTDWSSNMRIGTTSPQGDSYGGVPGSSSDTLGYHSYKSGSATLNLTGLLEGQEYAIQYWVQDIRAGAETRTLTLDDQTTLDYNISDTANSGVGQWAVGTFTADNTGSQTINITSATYSEMNLFQLRAIPEPSAALLGGLGLLALLRRRR